MEFIGEEAIISIALQYFLCNEGTIRTIYGKDKVIIKLWELQIKLISFQVGIGDYSIISIE